VNNPSHFEKIKSIVFSNHPDGISRIIVDWYRLEAF
jgi:hypothetical protein